MPSYNRVILMGHATRDPNIRTFNDTVIASFGVATNRVWKNQKGEKQEEVCFVDCTAFKRQAEIIREYVKKGDLIHIEGRLKLERWETEHGEKRQKLSVTVDQLQLMGGKKDDSAEPGPDQQSQPQTNGNQEIPDDEIPY